MNSDQRNPDDSTDLDKPRLTEEALVQAKNPDLSMRSRSREVRMGLVADARAKGNQATEDDKVVLAMDAALTELEPNSASAVRAFELHYFGQLDTASIALRMGVPIETARFKRKIGRAVVAAAALKTTSGNG